MDTFAQKFSTEFENVNEEILERRISPYVTLRPGDLLALLKLYFTWPNCQKLNREHGTNANIYRHVDTIFEKKQPKISAGDSEDDKSDCSDDGIDTICRGADQGHVPVEYEVKGLRRHEMPVIGVYIDKRICPGFKYNVRRIDTNSFLWGNKARTLESMGIGYGRRLTFSGDQLNNNDYYFWSDSEPSGYAFSIQAVEAGERFIIKDSSDHEVGEAVINRICGVQEETSMSTGKSGVMKRVNVTIACSVTYHKLHRRGSKAHVYAKDQQIISGEAVLFKPRSVRKAHLVSIEKVFFPRAGHCKLVPIS